ncbi:MAG TPA: tetratricopeptide repeat protein [Pyrinomonadaceae bacterium]|nr:tetratricopeptide repeat protein [Pyrinomonadaceae bacterium]
MKFHAIMKGAFISVVACCVLSLTTGLASAQSVGDDIGAGVFKPKNPETKRRTPKSVKPVTKPTRKPDTALDDRIDDLLDKGNNARDAKKYGEAQEAYEGVLKLRAHDARGAYGLGNVYTDQRRWEDAEKAYRDAVEWSPKDVDALVALSVVSVQPVAGANNAKRFADAQGFAQRAVQLDPKNAVAWDRLGVALQSRGLFNNETEHAYRRAVELDPKFAVAYVHLGRVLRRMGKGDEAAPLYDRARELANEPATLVLIADSLQAEQQWDKSEPVLRKALAIDARNTSALYLLGRALIVLTRQQEAEPYLKTAIELSPQSFQSYNLLGQAYLALGRYDDAEKIYNSAVDLASPAERKQLAGAFGFEGVGDGYLKAKRRPDAARAYRRALDLDPDNRQLQSKVSKVRG